MDRCSCHVLSSAAAGNSTIRSCVRLLSVSNDQSSVCHHSVSAVSLTDSQPSPTRQPPENVWQRSTFILRFNSQSPAKADSRLLSYGVCQVFVRQRIPVRFIWADSQLRSSCVSDKLQYYLTTRDTLFLTCSNE